MSRKRTTESSPDYESDEKKFKSDQAGDTAVSGDGQERPKNFNVIKSLKKLMLDGCNWDNSEGDEIQGELPVSDWLSLILKLTNINFFRDCESPHLASDKEYRSYVFNSLIPIIIEDLDKMQDAQFYPHIDIIVYFVNQFTYNLIAIAVQLPDIRNECRRLFSIFKQFVRTLHRYSAKDMITYVQMLIRVFGCISESLVYDTSIDSCLSVCLSVCDLDDTFVYELVVDEPEVPDSLESGESGESFSVGDFNQYEVVPVEEMSSPPLDLSDLSDVSDLNVSDNSGDTYLDDGIIEPVCLPNDRVGYDSGPMQKCDITNLLLDVLNTTHPFWRTALRQDSIYLASSCLNMFKYGRRSAMKRCITTLALNQCEILLEAGRQDIFFRCSILRLTAALMHEILFQSFDMYSDDLHMKNEDMAQLRAGYEMNGVFEDEESSIGEEIVCAEMDAFAQYLDGISRQLLINPTYFTASELQLFELTISEPCSTVIWTYRDVFAHYHVTFVKLFSALLSARKTVIFQMEQSMVRLITGAIFLSFLNDQIPFDLTNELIVNFLYYLTHDASLRQEESNVKYFFTVLDEEIITQMGGDPKIISSPKVKTFTTHLAHLIRHLSEHHGDSITYMVDTMERLTDFVMTTCQADPFEILTTLSKINFDIEDAASIHLERMQFRELIVPYKKTFTPSQDILSSKLVAVHDAVVKVDKDKELAWVIAALKDDVKKKCWTFFTVKIQYLLIIFIERNFDAVKLEGKLRRDLAELFKLIVRILLLGKSQPRLLMNLFPIIASTYASDYVVNMYKIWINGAEKYVYGYQLSKPVTEGNFKMIIKMLNDEFGCFRKMKFDAVDSEVMVDLATFIADFLDVNQQHLQSVTVKGNEFDTILQLVLMPIKYQAAAVNPNICRVFKLVNGNAFVSFIKKENINRDYLEKFAPEMFPHLATLATYCHNMDELFLTFSEIYTFLLHKMVKKSLTNCACNAIERIISSIPSLLFEHETLFVKTMVQLMVEVFIDEQNPQFNDKGERKGELISLHALLDRMSTLCRYVSPRDLYLSKQSLIIVRDEQYPNNAYLERYACSYTSLNHSWLDLVYREKMMKESNFIAKAFCEGIPIICVGPHLLAFMFTHESYNHLFKKFIDIADLPPEVFEQHNPPMDQVDGMDDFDCIESFPDDTEATTEKFGTNNLTHLIQMFLPIVSSESGLDLEIMIARMNLVVTSWIEKLYQNKNPVQILKPLSIHHNFLDAASSPIYNSLILKLPNKEKEVLNRVETSISRLTKEKTTISKMLNEKIVFMATYGILYNKDFRKSPKSKPSHDKTISLYANQLDYERTKSALSRHFLIKSGVRYLTVFELLQPSLKKSFYYQLHQVMRILMRYDFLHPIGIRLWNSINQLITISTKKNISNKLFLDEFRYELYGTINLPILVFTTTLDRECLPESKTACQNYLETLLQFGHRYSDKHNTTIEYTQPYVSKNFDVAAVFATKLVDSQELIYLSDRIYLKKVLGDHTKELPESRRVMKTNEKSDEVPELIQRHAVKELLLLMQKFELNLNIVNSHKATITELKRRLHFITGAPSVMQYASKLVPYLGRFQETVEIPHQRMYWNKKKSAFVGILSRWYANTFVKIYGRFILEYNPDVSSKIYHLIAKCWNEIKSTYSFPEGEDTPLDEKTRTSIRDIQTVVRNVLEIMQMDKARTRPITEMDYMNRDKRRNGKVDMDGNRKLIRTTWLHYKDPDFNE